VIAIWADAAGPGPGPGPAVIAAPATLVRVLIGVTAFEPSCVT
jgi:hypothetical protein